MAPTSASFEILSMSSAITSRAFGTCPQGLPVTEYLLTNHHGHQLAIGDFGATVTRLCVPDREGKLGDVVLGFDHLEPYLGDVGYMGAIIGRVGNRIANARFVLDGETHVLVANGGPNNLHGGPEGFDKRLWQAEPFSDECGPGLRLRLLSPHGDQGFPGNLQVQVTYHWVHNSDGSSELRVDYLATSDRPTPVNLTQHSYFNLAGQGDVGSHRLMIAADRINAINPQHIPEGQPMAVAGTPFDFRKPRPIGEAINADHEQIRRGFGYDHNFLINQPHYKAMTLAARVEEDSSGRVLEVYTQEPGVQFYSGNFIAPAIGKGVALAPRSGFCLEPQHSPDAINQPQFPSIVLRPGETYSTQTRFKFSQQFL